MSATETLETSVSTPVTPTENVKHTSEQIAPRKFIVYKALIDPMILKVNAEKIKDRLFVKYGFLKPNPLHIQLVSFEKDYETFVIVDGKYTIDYYRRRFHTVKVDNEVQEVIFFDQTLKPEPSNEPLCKIVRIEVEEHLVHQEKAYLVLSSDGKEVSPKRIPLAPSEEQSNKILDELQGAKQLGMLPDEEIRIIKRKIVKRPAEIKRIVNEVFEVSDRAVIFTPIYKMQFQNISTGETRTIKFDGITAKILT